jgi:hypothetical protein
MRTHRFGREIKLPATVVIKHQIRTGMAQHEQKRTDAEVTTEAPRTKAREGFLLK